MNSTMMVQPSTHNRQDAPAPLFGIRFKVFRQHKKREDTSQQWNIMDHHDNPGLLSGSGSCMGRETSPQCSYPSRPAQNPPNGEVSDFSSDPDKRHSRATT